MTNTLELVIPGLFGPWPEDTDVAALNLELPALQRLLGRAVEEPCPQTDFESLMFALFGVEAPAEGRDLPVAAVTRLGDGGSPDDGYWLRADPVHLSAEMHQVRLFDARFLDLRAEEAADLVAEIEPLLEPNAQLRALHPARWYMRCAGDPGIRTTPLPQLIGRDINPHLPHGPNKERWHGLLTEIQMQIHASDVNSERAWDNQLPVNSVWFWGGGRLPPPPALRPPAARFYADDPLSRGLCLRAEPRPNRQRLPPDLAAVDSASGAFAVFETMRYYVINDDVFRWADRLAQLETNWFAPALERLRAGSFRELRLYPCRGVGLRVTRAALRRFWRPVRPLVRQLDAAPPADPA